MFVYKIALLVMINCGGRIDLVEKAKLLASEGREIRILLLDAHRPLHHANLRERKEIWLVDDGSIDRSSCPNEEEIKLVEEGEGGPLEEGDEAEEDAEEANEDDEEKDIRENMLNFVTGIPGQNNGQEKSQKSRESSPEKKDKSADKIISIDKTPQKSIIQDKIAQGTDQQQPSFVQDELEEIEIGKKRFRRLELRRQERRRQHDIARRLISTKGREILQR